MTHAAHDTTRIDVDDLGLRDMALNAVMPACSRLDIGHYARAKHVYNVLADLVTLQAGGGNEAEARAVVLAVTDLVDTLYGGVAATDDAVAARLELHADCAEDHIAGVIAIEGESATLLEEHAHALTKQATASLVLARSRQRRARQLRSNRGVARQRFGLGGAA